jgi:GNAT superfamily N-acetyltransferase
VELGAADRERWAELWRAYLAFYDTTLAEDVYAATWARIIDPDGPISALGVRGDDGRLVGIAHYLVHAHAWSTADVCYLQDLYVDEAYRGRGCATALIAAVADAARARGCFRLYWSTQEGNATARSLYDKIARFSGFIRYDYPLDSAP